MLGQHGALSGLLAIEIGTTFSMVALSNGLTILLEITFHLAALEDSELRARLGV